MYEQVFQLQMTHWWYSSRQRFLDVLLRRMTKGEGRVLDAGCGPGSMLHYFEGYGKVTGLDSYHPALQMARTHFDGLLVQGDAGRLPFHDEQFTLVAACEVLYHRNVNDVRQAVAELARVLEPGGCLLVVDSAYSACASEHDEVAHGARRFSRCELIQVFSDAGLEVLHATYAYALLLPVVWAIRRWKAKQAVPECPRGELKAAWGPLNKLLVWWFSQEAKVAGRWGLPFGLSVQILGRKPKE